MVGVSRLQSVRMPARAEPVALLLAGAAAGCLSCLVRLHLGIPGHAMVAIPPNKKPTNSSRDASAAFWSAFRCGLSPPGTAKKSTQETPRRNA